MTVGRPRGVCWPELNASIAGTVVRAQSVLLSAVCCALLPPAPLRRATPPCTAHKQQRSNAALLPLHGVLCALLGGGRQKSC